MGGYKRHTFNWLALASDNIVLSCAPNKSLYPQQHIIQCSQFYISLGIPGSSMILDMPQSTSETSPKFPVFQIDVSPSHSFVLPTEVSAIPSTSAWNDCPSFPNNVAGPSSPEDALVEKFMDSIIISEHKSDNVSGTNSTAIVQETVHFKALKLKKETLAIRRGVPKPFDLDLPISGPSEGQPNTADMNLELLGRFQDIPPITPLDQMIPNPVSPPPAPKPRQAPFAIKTRRASPTHNSTRMIRAGLFTSPVTACPPVNATRANPSTPILDIASFLAISKEPSRPLLSPFNFAPDRSYGVYRPMSSPMDTDFDLYGPLATPMGWSPTKCAHAR